jgi:hypothetical protein
VPNADQADTEPIPDGIGDACDGVYYWYDGDGDNVGSGIGKEYMPGTQPSDWAQTPTTGDNCPDVANEDQKATYNDPLTDDDDNRGNACDAEHFALYRSDRDANGQDYIVYSRQMSKVLAYDHFSSGTPALFSLEWWNVDTSMGDVCVFLGEGAVPAGGGDRVLMLALFCNYANLPLYHIKYQLLMNKFADISSTDGCIAIPIDYARGEFDPNNIQDAANIKNGPQHEPCYDNLPISTNMSPLSVQPSTLTYGQSTTISGKLTASSPQGHSGALIELRSRPTGVHDSPYDTIVNTIPADDDGNFAFEGLKPDKNTQYRVKFYGDTDVGMASAQTDTQQVGVKVQVTQTTPTTALKLGRYKSIEGAVSPHHGGYVNAHIRRNGETFANKRINLVGSEYQMMFRPPKTGTYSVTASYPNHEDHLGNKSPTKTFKVVR